MVKRSASDKIKKISPPSTNQPLTTITRANEELTALPERLGKSAARRFKDKIFNRDGKEQKLREAASEALDNSTQIPTLAVTVPTAPDRHQIDVIARLKQRLISNKEETAKQLKDLSDQHVEEIRKLDHEHTNVVGQLGDLMKELTAHNAQNTALLKREKDELAKDYEKDIGAQKDKFQDTMDRWSKQVGDLSAKNAKLENEVLASKAKIETLEKEKVERDRMLTHLKDRSNPEFNLTTCFEMLPGNANTTKELIENGKWHLEEVPPCPSTQPSDSILHSFRNQVSHLEQEYRIVKTKLAGEEGRTNAKIEKALKTSMGVIESHQKKIVSLQEIILFLEEETHKINELHLKVEHSNHMLIMTTDRKNKELDDVYTSHLEDLKEQISSKNEEIDILRQMRDNLIEGNGGITVMSTALEGASSDAIVSTQAEQLVEQYKMIHSERQRNAKLSDRIAALRNEIRQHRNTSRALEVKTKDLEDLQVKSRKETAEFHNIELAMLKENVSISKSQRKVQDEFSLFRSEVSVREVNYVREFQRLNDQIDRLTQENTSLKACPVATQPRTSGAELLNEQQGKVDRPTSGLQARTDKLENLVKEVVKKDSILKDRKEKIASQSAQIETMRKELGSIKKELQKLQADSEKGSVEVQKRVVREKENALVKSRESLGKAEQEKAELQNQATQFQYQVATLTSRIDDLTKALNQTKALWEKFRPIIEIGVHVRNRYMEQNKLPYERNTTLVELGNFAAHGGAPVADALLYETELPLVPRSDFYRYQIEYGFDTDFVLKCQCQKLFDLLAWHGWLKSRSLAMLDKRGFFDTIGRILEVVNEPQGGIAVEFLESEEGEVLYATAKSAYEAVIEEYQSMKRH